MASLTVGRVCMKIAGREAGCYAVVIKAAGKGKEEKSFVMITGPKLLTGVKRRLCNIDHLEPLQHMVEIKEDASDEEVIAALDKAGLVTKLDLKKPSAADMKAEGSKEKPAKPEKQKKEEKKKDKDKEKDKEKEKGKKK